MKKKHKTVTKQKQNLVLESALTKWSKVINQGLQWKCSYMFRFGASDLFDMAFLKKQNRNVLISSHILFIIALFCHISFSKLSIPQNTMKTVMFTKSLRRERWGTLLPFLHAKRTTSRHLHLSFLERAAHLIAYLPPAWPVEE